MAKTKKIRTTGWAIVHYGQLWPWTGGFVFRRRATAIARWIADYKPWRQCYRDGDRAVRVTVEVNDV